MKAIAFKLMQNLLIALAMMLVVAPVMAQDVGHRAASDGREIINFNADWRFLLGDQSGAEAPAFDDSGWQSVGLPHSFSIPYFQSPSFYVGYGWYRKTFDLPELTSDRRIAIEFEGAFQDTEVYVNGTRVGHHLGGYTGFSFDLTPALKVGRNVVAVRVNNIWKPTLAPRAGEHVFSGGIYRDVWLVATNDVHVPWTGTWITTPDISKDSSRVQALTEVRNDDDKAINVTVRTRIIDDAGGVVSILPDAQQIVAAGQTAEVTQLSEPIANPRLWSPKTPVRYTAETRLIVDGREADSYTTAFGFRWFEWTADKGFFLNGEHHYFKGANVHQDQAGWGDAVTNGAIERDVQMIKDAGFDFIRGSHYPHDPHFATATDRIGMLFVSEGPFWGTAGFQNPWGAPAYPSEPEHRAAFDASVKAQHAAMIRIFRNHPSIVGWSLGNEVFFTKAEALPEVRRLLKELVDITHEIDPTRPAIVGGAQRGEVDSIGDVAAYNGDGSWMYINPGFPSFVSEYGSPMGPRPGDYTPGWGDLEKAEGGAEKLSAYNWRYPWRSGEVIWTGFDHGSIAGRTFGSMGIVDYARLPKRIWYWYRNEYMGIAPPAWPREGTPAALTLTSSATTLKAGDGTDDVQLIVTVVDSQGAQLSNSPPVTLTIVSGPGEFPTGRTITFDKGTDIAIRDGQAAIALRSWQSGRIVVRATSEGLSPADIVIEAKGGPAFVDGVTPLVAERPYVGGDNTELAGAFIDLVFGQDNPTGASSSRDGHPTRRANDGDLTTHWQPAPTDTAPWLMIDVERLLKFTRLELFFAHPGVYGVRVEIEDESGQWVTVTETSAEAGEGPYSLTLPQTIGRRIRLNFSGDTPFAGVAEVRLYGFVQTQ